MSQRVVISSNIAETLTEAVGRVEFDRLFVLTDNTTIELCWPLIENLPCVADAKHICIGSTDIFKNLDTLASVWTALQEGGATRHSLMICLGGGMVTDLGGFAASTFKRAHGTSYPAPCAQNTDHVGLARSRDGSYPVSRMTSCALWQGSYPRIFRFSAPLPPVYARTCA